MPADGGGIVLAGMACRFPDATSPSALLENSLEGRRSFRPIPESRLRLGDYEQRLIGEADSITQVPAGLLTGWRFDARRFRVPKNAYESADLTHWLALEVAADAIDAAGGPAALERERTAVIVANTLTGEFSRSAMLRLRGPWLDRQLEAALADAGIEGKAAEAVRGRFRDNLRAAFPAPDEETLAGGLSNTIAGRISNHFDLHGGAYTVDAACASSLVALANAAELIAAGRVSAALVVAVDLSLDPFELVGFSRNGALAQHRMRVFDARAEGFWPGEGAGAVLLLDADRARPADLADCPTILGWGLSTDGHGGLTRPTADGQRRALERAYRQAAAAPAEIGFVEAHGTGTAAGDPTEVEALATFVGASRARPLPIASIKGNIGHTKAAAGLAGLIRTAGALQAGLIPPHVGCDRPHPIFAATGSRVRVATAPEQWPAGRRRIAGVSSFGFGGINAHVVLSGPSRARSWPVPATAPVRDDCLFLFRGDEPAALRAPLAALAARAPSLSLAEIGDAAAEAARNLGDGAVRLAFRAADPGQLAERASRAVAALDGGSDPLIRLGRADGRPRIGLVFPGQAAPARRSAGAWGRLFPGRFPPLSIDGDPVRTDNAQPLIARACLAGLDLLDRLDVLAAAALGHSLGELVALSWAGAIDRDALPGLVAERGRAMAALAPGAMVQLECDRFRASALADGLELAPACFNAGEETVMSGAFAAAETLQHRAEAAGIRSRRLGVSHAFHSPMMAPAAARMAAALDGIGLRPPERPVASTVTGAWLGSDADLRALLLGQLTRPVQFTDAAAALADKTDVLIEVGPGAGLGRLLAGIGKPVASLDVFAEEIGPALDAIGLLFALGEEIAPGALFEGPGLRALPAEPPLLLASPCGGGRPVAAAPAPPRPVPAAAASGDALSRLIALVAEETELDAATISPDDSFLKDLHLNSLAVSRLVARLGQSLGRRQPGFATALADASLRQVAEAFEESEPLGDVAKRTRIDGVAPWVRRFETVSVPLAACAAATLSWHRTSLDSPDHGEADGLLIGIGPWQAERDAWPLLQLCQQAVGRYRHLALRHDGAPLSGFARSIAAEALFESVRLIEGAAEPALLDRAIGGFEEIVRTADGAPATPELTVRGGDGGPVAPVAGAILVTGGARGIAAECAVRLAMRHRSPMILAGRTAADDREVVETMDRLAAAGIAARYVRADVADRGAMRAGVAAAVAALGPITLLVHAAGVNEPAAFAAIDAERLERALAAKSTGLAVAVDCCGPSLKRAIAFGSIIGRLGLAGEAHYALANAEQTRLLATIAEGRPGLSALSIEWSVWSGAGMGERLGAIERLDAAGVDALSLDDALDAFEALAPGPVEGALVVTSRFGSDAPVRPGAPLRFVERSLVHTPGVELVVESRVGMGRDPYLADHVIGGGAVMPGVMLLEGLAQAFSAFEAATPAGFDDVRFSAAVHAGDTDLPLRIALLRDADRCVRGEMRSAADDFQDACVSAGVRARAIRWPAAPAAAAMALDAAPLYGPLFFHGPRFRRLAALGDVSSRSVSAVFTAGPPGDWFGAFEAQTLLLGDPGRRDAALHALQCCVPHRRLIPISAKRIAIRAGVARRLHARELWSRGGDYAFDITLVDERNRVVEHWQEAVFRTVGAIEVGAVLAVAPALARAFLERRAREEAGDDSIVLALVEAPGSSREQRRRRAAEALGLATAPARRGDGRPVGENGRQFSFSHCGDVTIGVGASRRVGCDVEQVAAFASAELALAWTAEESLRKLGSRAALRRNGDSGFTGEARERIAALAQVPTGGGAVAVSVGTAAE